KTRAPPPVGIISCHNVQWLLREVDFQGHFTMIVPLFIFLSKMRNELRKLSKRALKFVLSSASAYASIKKQKSLGNLFVSTSNISTSFALSSMSLQTTTT